MPPDGLLNPMQKVLIRMNETPKRSCLLITPTKNSSIITRVAVTKKLLPKIKYLHAPNNHAKMVIFHYKAGEARMWNGSCNFSSSQENEFSDIMTEVILQDDQERVVKLFCDIIRVSRPL